MLEGKNVFITGASAGIGAGLARELAAHGANLALVARRGDRLEALRDELEGDRSHPIRVVTAPADVTVDGSLEAATAVAVAELGAINVVVANAGFGVGGRLERLTLEDYRRQFETNVFGVLRTIYATLPELKRTGGRLVIIGSVAGHVAVPRASAYSMSKFALRALAEAIRPELAAEGVTVTLISPGFVVSDIGRVDNRGQSHARDGSSVPAWLRMPTAEAARQIVAAIEAGRREAVITGHGKLLVFLSRHFPWLLHALIEAFARRRASRRNQPTRPGDQARAP